MKIGAVFLLLGLCIATVRAQVTYTPDRIYCYLSQGPTQFMQYTVNSKKYQCARYRYRCDSTMSSTCSAQQITRKQWRTMYSIMTPADCKAKQAEARANPNNLKSVVCCSKSDCTKPNLKAEPFLQMSFHFGELN